MNAGGRLFISPLATLAAIMIAAPEVTAAQPRLVCDPAIYDFGSLSNRDEIAHVFTLQNAGDAALTIEEVKACCGASAKLANATIPPGSNTTLDVRLSLKGRNGTIRKAFPIVSNDPTNRLYSVYLTGRATGAEPVVAEMDVRNRTSLTVGDLVVAPGEVRLFKEAGEGMDRHIAIVSRSGRPFQILKTIPPDPEIRVKLTMLNDHGWQITLRDMPPPESLRGTNLVIITDQDGPASRIVVPVQITDRPRITIHPMDGPQNQP